MAAGVGALAAVAAPGARSSNGAGSVPGELLHAASAAVARAASMGRMWLLIAEALIALLMLVFIVWWTMFSGRRRGELRSERKGEREGARKDDSEA